MFKVELSRTTLGRDVANVYRNDKFVGAASLSFIRWMNHRVPEQLLRPEQLALIEWYRDQRTDRQP